MIELAGVSYSYQTQPEPTPAISDVTLSIEDGQFVALLGRNGSGKSTLARLLNGLLMPDEGYVSVDDVATADSQGVWAVRRSVGMVFANPDSQIVATTIEEEVAFGLENLGVPPDEMRLRITGALAAVGLQGMERREPHLLSGGQKQRLAIAGVLAMRPRHIVLDEATSMLDAVGRREVESILRELNAELGATVLTITHFVEEAAGADRVIVLRDGTVAMDGAPADVLSLPEELRRAGILPPYAAALAERLRGEGVAVPEGVFSAGDLVDAICTLN